METNRKIAWLPGLAAIMALTAVTVTHDGPRPASDNEISRKIRQKLGAIAEEQPEDRLYVQLDRPFYQPGDDIWFSAWVRNGQSLIPSEKSDIVHAELINPKGGVEKKISLIARDGLTAGDFSIDASAPGGIYKLRVYTTWMKNEGDDRCFEKKIQVQDVVLPALKMKLDFVKKTYGAGDDVQALLEVSTNENKPLASQSVQCQLSLAGAVFTTSSVQTDVNGHATIRFRLPATLKTSDGLINVMIGHNGTTESISRSVPITRNVIKMAFYPEGGDLVAGLSSRVAFRVVDEFGKPADIDGELADEEGRIVARFSSYHMGMGSFMVTPNEGKRYFARIVRPAGIGERFELPEPAGRGVVMQLQAPSRERVRVKLNSSLTGEMTLMAQMRGRVLYTAPVAVSNGSAAIEFTTENFPAGVLQVTLFDDKTIPRAERLVFVNRDRQLQVSVRPEKQKYLPREKIKLNILVKDERGMPAPALLSMAVVNDALLSFADDRSGNLLSQLLLQDDVREQVEEPAFYFDRTKQKSAEALDLLMMTSGWRRFTWEQVLDGGLPELKYEGERALIAGTVVDAYSGQPIEGALVSVEGKKFRTDKKGRVNMNGIELYQPLAISIEGDGYHSATQYVHAYGAQHTWHLYDRKRPHYSAREAWPSMAMAASDAGEPRAREEGSVKPAPKAGRRAMAQPAAKEKAVTAKKIRSGAQMEEAPFRKMDFRDERNGAGAPVRATKYYRARQFAAPVYTTTQAVVVRDDFRNTIYWNPRIEVGYSGRTSVEFYAPDDITSFRTIVEGIGRDGLPGRTESVFYTQMPFQLITKLPVHVTGGDAVQFPVTLRNNTARPLGGVLRATLPAELTLVKSPDSVQTIMPGEAKTVYYSCRVNQAHVDTTIGFVFSACAMEDAVSAQIKIRPQGFPAQVSFSGQWIDKQYTFEVNHLVKNSMRMSFTAYPDVISDLMKGVEGILREPYGCFEQTSCTAYPNAMVLHYLKNAGNENSRLLASTADLLDRGYKRLTTFETPSKGYEWFGASPAHEGLTAYGIMEFTDMKRAGQQVDEQMLERTARWLLNRRDGNGGFTRGKRALHDFGRISDDVMNTYIVYALSDAGYTDLEKEFEHAVKTAVSKRDPYLLALAANASYKMKKTAAAGSLMRQLLTAQAKDGSFTGSSHSITYSQGRSLSIETTALAILAMLEGGNPDAGALDRAVRWLLSMREGSGAFSSTQGTILALKALTEYAIFNKRVKEDGEIVVYVDGRIVAKKQYKAGEKGEIRINGLEKFVGAEGKHTVRIRYNGVEQPLPYSVSAEWCTALPVSQPECVFDVTAAVMNDKVKVGETARLRVVLKNRKKDDQPGAMLVVGLPAGLSAQPWQLKELQERKMFDYYEILGDKLALYYRGVAPSAIHEINLDLKAEVPGEFNFPAACAYLYYTNEFKSWTGGEKIVVTAN